MKKLILFFPILLIGLTSNAQDVDYGFKVSRNASYLHGSYIKSQEDITISLEPDLSWRHSMGVFVRYNITTTFSVQPELLYTTRGVHFKENVIIRDQDMRVEGDLTLRYIELPLLLRISNRKPIPQQPVYEPPGYSYNGYTGLSFAYNTSARFSGDLSGDLFGVDFDEPFSSRVRDQFTATDINFILGAGFEYGRHTRFIFDIRYAFSILDIGKDPDFSGDIRNSAVSVMMGVVF